MIKSSATALALLALLALSSMGWGGPEDYHGSEGVAGSRDEAKEVSLVAYATPEVVYDEIIPAFRSTPTGSGMRLKTSFGASGEQSRAVEGGLPADVVSFSLEPDIARLVAAGLVDADWSRGPHRGMVTTSVVTFIVRAGNPRGVRTWEDLLRPGLEVVSPNPFTSGAAKWNLLAAYAVASRGGRDHRAGVDYLRSLITEQIRVQPKSSREALQSFLGGTGDVLLSYEYEAVTAQKMGEPIDYVTPPQTIRIDNPIAVTSGAPQEAHAFVDHLLSRPAQERFAAWGYRPVHPEAAAATRARFPEPRKLFTVGELGGWSKVDAQLFHPERGQITRIEESAGISASR